MPSTYYITDAPSIPQAIQDHIDSVEAEMKAVSGIDGLGADPHKEDHEVPAND